MSNSKYSAEFRATVLAHLQANNGNLRRTGLQFGISPKLVRYWRDHAENAMTYELSQASELLPMARKELADRLEDFVHDALSSTAEKIETANLQQLFVAIGISLDKMQLLKGRPTSISQNQTIKKEINEAAAKEAIQVLRDRGVVN